ncbi:MAG: pyridoxal phosphate-dependent aminotransferase [Desulfovibrionales bacterium]
MKILSDQVAGYLERSSWIRKMFEAGASLRDRYGAENVFDFSLGNPDLPPPREVSESLAQVARDLGSPFALGYMPNAGYADVREKLAGFLSKEQGVQVAAGDLVLSCGAAGGLNAFFRAVLEPGEEVVCQAPYFVEYGFYAQNHGGEFRLVPASLPDFGLDLAAIEAAIGPKTRIVLINSPNNPSGRVYTREELSGLADILNRKTREFGRPIFLLSDEPYRFLVYDGVQVPPVLPLYEYSVVINSFSKSLSLAGERIGYVLPNPAMQGKDELINGLVLTNRILGYVNAPAIGQKILLGALGAQVDTEVYAERREKMAAMLQGAGYDFFMPQGGFYFFPRAPGGDDVAFVSRLQEERVLAVPGVGFGCPGYFRLTFCVGTQTIERSAEGFQRALG